MATILVAEDEAIVRLLVVETLRNCGHAVLEAADGQSAWDLIQDCPDLDLLLSDIRLPKLDGFSLARFARQLRPDVGLLFLTGYVRAQPPEELSPAIIIRKPFDPDNLAKQVSAMLDAKLAASG
jgi:two-component system cell cycle sensor histidine kinase/response regulator CckA